jgi:hypothetical protein
LSSTNLIRQWLRRAPVVRRLRLARLNVIARTGAHEDHVHVVEHEAAQWRAALERAVAGPRVLIATNTGGHFAMSAMDRLLALVLTLRGAHTTSVLCDSALPACQMCEFSLEPYPARLASRGPDPMLCGYCFEPAHAGLERVSLPTAQLSAHITPALRAQAMELAQALAPDALARAQPGAASMLASTRSPAPSDTSLAPSLRASRTGSLSPVATSKRPF